MFVGTESGAAGRRGGNAQTKPDPSEALQSFICLICHEGVIPPT
jgi:hypothetical protein